jgi:hypothetical protein
VAKGNPIYNAIRRRIFNLIYPAQVLYAPTGRDFQELHNQFYNRNNPNAVQVKFNLAARPEIDLAKSEMDAVFIASPPTTINRKVAMYEPHKQYVIYIPDTCYEIMPDELVHLADNGQTNIIAFNPPGVGYSTGSSNGPEDIEAALTVVINNLLANNIPVENIVLMGRGIMSNIALAYKQKATFDVSNKTPKVTLVADQYIANLPEYVDHKVRNFSPFKVLYYTAGAIAGFIAKQVIKLFDLAMHVDTAQIAKWNTNTNVIYVNSNSSDRGYTKIIEFLNSHEVARQNKSKLPAAVNDLVGSIQNGIDATMSLTNEIDRVMSSNKPTRFNKELRDEVDKVKNRIEQHRSVLEVMYNNQATKHLISIEQSGAIGELLDLAEEIEALQTHLDKLAHKLLLCQKMQDQTVKLSADVKQFGGQIDSAKSEISAQNKQKAIDDTWYNRAYAAANFAVSFLAEAENSKPNDANSPGKNVNKPSLNELEQKGKLAMDSLNRAAMEMNNTAKQIISGVAEVKEDLSGVTARLSNAQRRFKV